MRRNTAIFSVLTAAGLIVAAPFVLKPSLLNFGERNRGGERAGSRDPDREVHVPRGFIDADTVPAAAPVPWDRDADEESRPYDLLVELIRFSDLAPFDEVEARHVEVMGARVIEKVGAGRFLCSDIDLALTNIRVIDPNPAVIGTGHPGESRPSIAVRSTVALARHRVTRVSVIVVRNEDLDIEFEGKGVVQDRFTREPMPGVVVSTSNAAVLTDEEGRFEFEEPLRVRNLMGLSVATDGYWPFRANFGLLSKPWLDHWRETGDMLFTLRPSKEYRTYRPLENVDD